MEILAILATMIIILMFQYVLHVMFLAMAVVEKVPVIVINVQRLIIPTMEYVHHHAQKDFMVMMKLLLV